MFLLKGRNMTKRFSLTIFIFMFASLLALGQEAIPGKRIVLRKGTNGIICRANTTAPGFNVY